MNKPELRRLLRGARRALAPEEHERRSKAVCDRLASLPELTAAQTVLAYVPEDGEVDIIPFLRVLQSRGVTVAFPVCGADGQMEAYVPHSENDWRIGRFGIPEPDPDKAVLLPPEAIDVILTPCVAADGELRRLGRGGGYYDRYFLRASGAARIGIVFDFQLRDLSALCEPWDLSLSAVVSDGNIFRS